MKNITEILREYDEIMRFGNVHDASDYLKEQLINATQADRSEDCLTILNEMIGLYRSIAQFDLCLVCIDEVRELAETMQLTGTDAYATTLINCATAYRMMNMHEEALHCFEEAEELIENNPSTDAYLKASLHNNFSNLHMLTGHYKEAEAQLEKALAILETMENQEIEIAITCANIAGVYAEIHDSSKAKEYLEKADALFREYDNENPHYASVLSSYASLLYEDDALEEALVYYEKAQDLIVSVYGRNSDYDIIERNKNTVKDLLKRREKYQEIRLGGLELSRAYYEACGKDIMKDYPGVPYAIGLCGEGSECLGYDDEYSTDHDFGPAFCLWLRQEDYMKYGAELKEKYGALPQEFMGYPKRNTSIEGVARYGVLNYEEWMGRILGMAYLPVHEFEWMSVSEHALVALTNGEIFVDSGFMKEMRDHLSFYPHKVIVYRLTDTIGMIAQAGQYNYPRALKRNDPSMAYMCLSEFLHNVIQAAYLLNKRYMPYYKWAVKDMEKFVCLKDLQPKIEELMKRNCMDHTNITLIEEICADIKEELRRQNYTTSDDYFLESHHRQLLRKKETDDKIRRDR